MTIPNLTAYGKVALITGGRGGLGKAFALAFAEAGADIAICDCFDEDGKLEEVGNEVSKLGRGALAIRADVSCRTDVEKMVKETLTKFGDIDILINSAGVLRTGSLLETEEDTWDLVIGVNLKGCYLCSQAVGRVMVERRKGNIINMASTHGFKPLPYRTAYGISKAAVITLTRILARELGSYNIRVNAVAPYTVRTPMTEHLLNDPQYRKAGLAEIPLQHFGETDDITGVALFLASDAAKWITGHTVVVDGGYLA